MDEIALHPKSRYVADLVGLNLLQGVVADEGLVRLANGGEVVIGKISHIGGAVSLAIHPRSVSLLIGESSSDARNSWPGRVVDVDSLGDRVRVQLAGVVPIVAEVALGLVRELELQPGSDVVASVEASDVHVYPA